MLWILGVLVVVVVVGGILLWCMIEIIWIILAQTNEESDIKVTFVFRIGGEQHYYNQMTTLY